MAEKKDKTADELLQEIVNLDIEPSVFSVHVGRKDWSPAIEAWVVFRGDKLCSIAAQGVTVAEALQSLKRLILAQHCPHCGAYLTEEHHAG
jgi:hypothetical protein